MDMLRAVAVVADLQVVMVAVGMAVAVVDIVKELFL